MFTVTILLPNSIARTWGSRVVPADGVLSTEVCFWLWAIESVRERNADFVFMAQVYWGVAWDLQKQGFDFT